MKSRTYGVRYCVEPWNKPPGCLSRERPFPGVRVSDDNHGYADALLVASILRDEEGIASILLLATEGGPNPPRELLEAVRNAITHHLEHHCE